MKRDNTTLRRKVSLRLKALEALGRPARVVETHGGWGRIYLRCYRGTDGVVFESDPDKAVALAVQRPTWAVYEADCEAVLAAGGGFHHRPNFFDLDPYGEPWPTLDAVFAQVALWGDGPVGFAVNDGLRQKLKLKCRWQVGSMREALAEFGNESLYSDYLAVAKWLVELKAGRAGYRLARWAGYYCGHHGQMTHYAWLLEKC
jgi:hypothetical protein